MSAGVALRVAKADAARITDLVSQAVGFPCLQVVGRALWDVAERPELTAITDVLSKDRINLRGDFGHIFGASAELRWRRIDTDQYDVLILSDAPLEIEGADTLGEGWCIEYKTLQGKLRAAQYLAPNGAVQFVSYREVLP